MEAVLYKALEEISLVKQSQEKSLLMLVHGLQSYSDSMPDNKHNLDAERGYLLSTYQLMVSSVLMASLPRQFPGIYAELVRIFLFVINMWSKDALECTREGSYE